MFADKIKELRRAKNLSQLDVAQALFVSQQAVSKWENGKGYPDLPTLEALARLYGVSVDTLVGVEEYENAEKNKSIRPSPYFAFGLLANLILLIVADFVSGSFVRLFRDFLDNVGITRMIVFVSAGFFFLSCLAFVLFILLSQTHKLRIARFGEYDGLFFALYFLTLSLIDRFANPARDNGHATYLIIGMAALLFAALFLYYEREVLLLRRKAGTPGIRLNPLEEKVIKVGKKGEVLLWTILLVLLSAGSIALSLVALLQTR